MKYDATLTIPEGLTLKLGMVFKVNRFTRDRRNMWQKYKVVALHIQSDGSEYADLEEVE